CRVEWLGTLARFANQTLLLHRSQQHRANRRDDGNRAAHRKLNDVANEQEAGGTHANRCEQEGKDKGYLRLADRAHVLLTLFTPHGRHFTRLPLVYTVKPTRRRAERQCLPPSSRSRQARGRSS